MGIIIQKFVRWLIVLAPLWLSACIDIKAVQQPANGQVHAPFQVKIDVQSTNSCMTGNTCTPVVSVSLPAGWLVESCAYTGDVTGICSASSSGRTPSAAPTAPTNTWQTFDGTTLVPTADLPAGATATVTLKIRPTTTGTYALDYGSGASVGQLFGWGDEFSMNHPITIQAAAAVTAVPTLGTYGYALLALGLAAAALRRRRQSKDR